MASQVAVRFFILNLTCVVYLATFPKLNLGIQMMKAKKTSPAYLTRCKVFTYQDYLDLPEDGKRYEVINGDLIMVPGPNTDHQDISGNLDLN